MEDIQIETTMGARAPCQRARARSPHAPLRTHAGTFTVELYPKQAPKTSENFSELCARRPHPRQ